MSAEVVLTACSDQVFMAAANISGEAPLVVGGVFQSGGVWTAIFYPLIPAPRPWAEFAVTDLSAASVALADAVERLLQ